MKKLIVCCDGTWNWPEQKGGPTNVVKMVRAIEPADTQGRPQIVYYDPGVGTGNGLDRLIGGAFGIGLSQNVRDAYQFLVNNYEPGDAIFLFGFSRGAFTVRSLGGLIGTVGLLHKGDMDKFRDAYEVYRTYKPTEQEKQREDRTARKNAVTARLQQFEEYVERRRWPEIEMIGVWDTVGSLGVPFSFLRWVGRRHYYFHDTNLGPIVRNAYHALAIDDRRKAFAPTVWTNKEFAPHQRVEQVWFPGAHSNVGGGYPDRGLADVAFLWMVAKAARTEHGLKFDSAYVREKVWRYIRDEKNQNLLIDARKGVYLIWWPYRRQLCTTRSEKIHRSVPDRLSGKGRFAPKPYDPTNLQDFTRNGQLESLLADLDEEYEVFTGESSGDGAGGEPRPDESPQQQRDAAIDARKT